MTERGGDLSRLEEDLNRLEESANTSMIVMVDGCASGIVAVADTIKPSARPAIDALKKMGIDVVMLTGDNTRTAAAIAQKIGIDRYVAEVIPQQKEGLI